MSAFLLPTLSISIVTMPNIEEVQGLIRTQFTQEHHQEPSDDSELNQWLSELLFNDPEKHDALLGRFHRTLDSKLDRLSQTHCRLCTGGQQYPIHIIPLWIPPISKQASRTESRHHFEEAIRNYLAKITGNVPYGKDDKLCVLLIFLLGHNDKEKDLDNMTKALLDALQGHLFHNDSAIDHLNLIKLRDNERVTSGRIIVNIRKSFLHTNNDVLFHIRDYVEHLDLTSEAETTINE